MTKKSGLGKGLSALLSQAESGAKNNKTAQDKTVTDLKEKTLNTKTAPKTQAGVMLAIDKLQPGKYQPRNIMDADALSELSESIKTQGLLQPVIVRKIDNDYEIIAGERRWRAAQLAGLKEIPVIIRKVNDEDAMLIALVENLQREDLNVLEEARAMHRLTTEFDFTHQKIAELLGKSRESVSNCLRLLNLNKNVRWLLENGKIDMGHARAILTLDDSEQSKIAEIVIKKNLSVRETEILVKKIESSDAVPRAKHYEYLSQVYQPELEKLSQTFKTKVDIKTNKTGHGKLIIHYEDEAMLENVLNWLVN